MRLDLDVDRIGRIGNRIGVVDDRRHVAEITRRLHELVAPAEIRPLRPVDIFLDPQRADIPRVALKPRSVKKAAL